MGPLAQGGLKASEAAVGGADSTWACGAEAANLGGGAKYPVASGREWQRQQRSEGARSRADGQEVFRECHAPTQARVFSQQRRLGRGGASQRARDE